MSRLVAAPLTWELCEELATKVNPADSWECTRGGYTPLQALAGGLLAGKAYAVLQDDEPVGAFGFTCWHTIWSLWSPLSPRQSVQVLRETFDWVAGMVLRARPHTLWNYVDPDNRTAVEWLKASKAFRLDDHETYLPGVGPGLYFEAKAT